MSRLEVANEAAFYGPKIDVQVWSAIGREFTIATNQVDFAVPAKFAPDLPRQGQLEQDAVVHPSRAARHARAVHRLPHQVPRGGTGNFPLWLAPDQVRVLTLNDDEALINCAKLIVNELRAHTVRVDSERRRSRRRLPTPNNCASTRCWSSAVATWKPAR
jgi:threonyl-tRNA synthetase